MREPTCCLFTACSLGSFAAILTRPKRLLFSSSTWPARAAYCRNAHAPGGRVRMAFRYLPRESWLCECSPCRWHPGCCTAQRPDASASTKHPFAAFFGRCAWRTVPRVIVTYVKLWLPAKSHPFRHLSPALTNTDKRLRNKSDAINFWSEGSRTLFYLLRNAPMFHNMRLRKISIWLCNK